MSKFKVDTADGLSFMISSSELDKLDIIENQDGTFHLIYENKSYNIELLEADYLNKNYILNINEKEISVSLKDELDMAIEKMGFSKKAAEIGGEVVSPMPGLVIRMEVNIGDTVKKDDKLLILEAMKMENIIKAPVDGVVEKIVVKEGETVSKKQLLLVLN
jgi:biotin carboxyl carrier protein